MRLPRGKVEYRASVAQWKAQAAAKRPKPAKLATNPRLRDYVQQRLSGQLRRPDGTVVIGPQTGWKGRNKPRRQDRRWATAWSPEQIANRLPIDFPDDESMRISHEAIYQALFIEGRGALKRELVACLRTGRALRVPRARTRNKASGHVSADVVISQRPAEAEDRAVPGHWEGDLIIGLNRSAIGTLVDPCAGGRRVPGDARLAVFKWIINYNARRRHSACGYLSPTAYEHNLTTATLPAAA